MRDEFMANSRKASYMEKEYPKRLNGALLCAHVLKEREKQLELADAIKKHQMEEEELYAESVRKGVIEEQQEKQQEEQRAHERKRELRKVYLNECVQHLK